MELERLAAAQAGLLKTCETHRDGGVLPSLVLIEAASGPISPGASILDLGCGIGNGVATLLGRGFEARGVDLYEYWGKDADLYWEEDPVPPSPEAQSRLCVATMTPYKLPYHDESFDYVISSQVIEHVDDRQAVFAEIRRVLKPGATSVHIFPGRWSPLIEGHIALPFAALCKSRTYLKLGAFAGFKSHRQRGMGWREVYRSNAAQMEITHYPTRRQILRDAEAAGLAARFSEKDYVTKGRTGWTRLYRKLAPLGLGWLVYAVARVRFETMLVLTRRQTARECGLAAPACEIGAPGASTASCKRSILGRIRA